MTQLDLDGDLGIGAAMRRMADPGMDILEYTELQLINKREQDKLCDPFYGASLAAFYEVGREIPIGDGVRLKQAGIAATLAAERSSWRERAIELLGNYARLAKRPFSLEEFRQAWDELGYE